MPGQELRINLAGATQQGLQPGIGLIRIPRPITTPWSHGWVYAWRASAGL